MDRMLEATARAEDDHFWFRGLRRFAERLLDGTTHAPGPLQILDCGAGTGRNLDWLARYGRATGIEINPIGLEAGRARGRRLVRARVETLPVRTASIDLVTSFDVLYCLPDAAEAAAVAEMWRVLRPGGRVLVNAAALDVLRGSHSSLTHEVRRYTPGRLAAVLSRAGFVVERITFTNATLFLPALVSRGLERATGRADTASDADLRVPAPPFNALFDAALAAEAALLRVANLPIGTSVMAVGRKLT